MLPDISTRPQAIENEAGDAVLSIEIRDAAASDESEWLRLWADYLAFYDVKLSDDITRATWSRILDPASAVSMRVAADGDRLAGFAIHLAHPSTWVVNLDCYLEDLFVDESVRGQGVGRKLIDDLIAICDARGYERLYWHTDEGNARARALYDSYVKTDGHVRYRIRFER